MNLFQLIIFLIEGALVISLLLFLFRLRKKMGLHLLYACLGMFQFLQTFLTSLVYIEIFDNFLVSPGSTVLFTASLFAILLIYIKEDASETRKIVYTLLVANIVLAIILYTVRISLDDSYTANPMDLVANFFNINAWVWFIGTLALLLDSILLIIIYEFISKLTSKLFLRVIVPMVIVISFDSVFFSLGIYVLYKELSSVTFAGLIGKVFFAFYYSGFTYFYLRFFEDKITRLDMLSFRDAFQVLSYKQKYEIANLEKSQAIEEIQERDLKYYTLVNIAPVGIFHTDSKGSTTYVNPKWCSISGMKREDAIGDGWLMAVHPDDMEGIRYNWEERVTKGLYSNAQYRFIHKDGSVRWILGHATPEFNSKDQIVGYIGTITDITDIKQYQQEQERLRVKAEESDRLKSIFLANLSHEIRTPMNSILGFSEILMKSKELKAEERLQYLKLIDRSGKDMLNILSEIIDASKIQSGSAVVSPHKVNINSILEEIYLVKRELADDKKISLKIASKLPEERAEIVSDPSMITTILTHLIRNAIQYTNIGRVEYGCREVKEKIEFFVKDTGTGIPADFQQHLFRNIFQYNIVNSQTFNGFGLGLPIAKAYAEMLGGTITFDSKEGEGSTFYFSMKI